MRGRRKTYGVTVLLLSFCLVCFLTDVKLRAPITANLYQPYQIAGNETGLGVSQNVQALRFYNLFNTSLLKRMDKIDAKEFTTPPMDIADNVTRGRVIQTTAPSVNIRSRAHIVLIVSYMRSGSTLTADIMQHFPGAFYVFEPFHSIVLRTRRGQSLMYTNGTTRQLTLADLTDDLYREELRKWMECRFEELDVSSLADNFHQYFSRSMRKFANCWWTKRRVIKSLKDCIPVAKSICENAQYRLFKFIRLPMRVVDSVFDFYPNMQIVHLIRDPRGVMMSQVRVKKFELDKLPEKSREHCDSVADDVKYTNKLHRSHPNRIKVLLYENLAENPIATATRMYQFIGMVSYDYILKYVSNITHKGRRGRTDDFGVRKVNSTRTAYSWRDGINFTDVQTIDYNCHQMYEFLGYQSFYTAADVANHDLLTLLTPETSLII